MRGTVRSVEEALTTERFQQMSCLDQPVKATKQDHLLGNPTNRQDERVEEGCLDQRHVQQDQRAAA